MKERLKVAGVGFLVAIVILVACMLIQRNTQLSPVGGRNAQSAVQISYEETISVEVLLGKYSKEYYAYWDNNTQDKVKLKEGAFTAKGEIKVPKEIGAHKLTIKIGTAEYKYYYNVTE